jgi:hypothetical protein
MGSGKECPRCGLLNLDSALACDCGRLFDPIDPDQNSQEIDEPITDLSESEAETSDPAEGPPPPHRRSAVLEQRSPSSRRRRRAAAAGTRRRGKGPNGGHHTSVGSLVLVVALIGGAVGLGFFFGKGAAGTAPLPEARAQDAGEGYPPQWDNPEWYEGIFCGTNIHWGRHRLKFYKPGPLPTYEGTGWLKRWGDCTFKRSGCQALPGGNQFDHGDVPRPAIEGVPSRAPASFSAHLEPGGNRSQVTPKGGQLDVAIFGPCFETKMAFCFYPRDERGTGVKVHHFDSGVMKERPTCFLEWAQCEKRRTDQSAFDNVSRCLPMEWRDGALRLFEGDD